MLHGFPSKQGTGITIMGDFGDLMSLYETVHELSEALNEHNVRTKGQFQLLMNFGYEIRKAYSGQRLKKKLVFDGDTHKNQYYGFQLIWTDIIIFMETLRFNAGFVRTDSLHQAHLYMLEYIIEEAMMQYDEEGFLLIKSKLPNRIAISNQNCFLLYQAIHNSFLREKSGKQRFRNIPKLIRDYFDEKSVAYQELIQSLTKTAKEVNCEITDLELEDEVENIKW